MRAWLSWHIYQHDRQDELLVSAIAPLLSELRHRKLIDLAFVLRYWEGGPHVRLRLEARTEEAALMLEREVPRRILSWCRSHPSRRPMTQAHYEVMLERLGRADDDVHLHPDGSVVRAIYEPEVARFGTGAVLRACHIHFDSSTSMALEVLSTEPPEHVRDSLGVLVIADVIASMPRERRARWSERVFASPGPIVRIDSRLVREHLAHPAGVVREFRRSLGKLASTLSAGVASYEPPALGFGGVRFLEPGDENPTATLDIVAHLFCNRIGVPMPKELAIRRGIAASLRAAEDVA